jgi:hypothetical protein
MIKGAKRTTYVFRDGQLVEKGLVPPLDGQRRGPRSGLKTPHYISDGLPDIAHPSSGKIYSSKAAFRAETRARGLTEIGNEDFPERVEAPMPGPSVEEDIKMAYEALERGESVDAPI